MSTTIYWFRNDLRLSDNPALLHASLTSDKLLPVAVLPAEQETCWGFARVGGHRRVFLAQAIDDLAQQLQALGSGLLVLQGRPVQRLANLAHHVKADRIVCEAIPAPEEEDEVAALRAAGIAVECRWQSSLLDPEDLPFSAEHLPDVFTPFRQAVEKAGVQAAPPLSAPASLPPLPEPIAITRLAPRATPSADTRHALPSAFPYHSPAFHGGERAAQAHLAQYFARKLAHSYKTTRDRLHGIDASSKFSPWLATGALSARQVGAALRRFDQEHGANEGSYWLWFELLWRDYFRFLHRKYGRRLYWPSGLRGTQAPPHCAASFLRWRQGKTGEALIDAGMRELAVTGFLSNRMRQIVASYLVHDLGDDWRAGAAWFESQLIDYDVCSNQGNWLYLAGHGTDPRGGRRFNPAKQCQEHDPAGDYRSMWAD
jgi:deoxyribodipyrimidine photo-lyase